MATTAPHGTWPSPVSAAMVAAAARRVSEPRLDDGAVWWLEQRPDEGGRTAVVRRDADGTIRDALPAEANARTRVHEYGGGAYTVDGGTCFHVELADQRVYRTEPGGAPEAITPEPSEPAAVRFADLTPSPGGAVLYAVRETHHGPAATDVVNDLVAIPTDGSRAPAVLASGHDFYAAPRPSPDGTRLAFVAWDHPHMPWDETGVYVAELADGAAGEPTLVAGGPGRGESAIAPCWQPATGALHLMSDRSGWWNLHRVADPTIPTEATNLAPVAADLTVPPWQLGQPLCAFLPDGRIAVVLVEQARGRPAILDPDAGTVTALDTDLTACTGLAADRTRLWLTGASPTAFSHLACAEVSGEPSAAEVIRAHESRAVPVAADWLPQPQPRSVEVDDGERTHAFLYPPTSPTHAGPEGEAPPLIVTTHGGPTGHSPPVLSLATVFWTSRGFAVLDVNYRGSSGFGRAYRDALKGRWGLADVADVAALAQAAAAAGEADPARLAIRGGSAGGYTTLAALAFTDAFAAGASYYGVADLAPLAEETHKFESRYLDGLVAPYPERRDVYDARSPLAHAGDITCPVILLQGLEDRVVPPSQAEAMLAALAERAIPHAYVAFPDEPHGFRKAASLVTALEAEWSFYLQVLGLPHPEDLPPVPLR